MLEVSLVIYRVRVLETDSDLNSKDKDTDNDIFSKDSVYR